MALCVKKKSKVPLHIPEILSAKNSSLVFLLKIRLVTVYVFICQCVCGYLQSPVSEAGRLKLSKCNTVKKTGCINIKI